MRHLFIVNPVCTEIKGDVDSVIAEVRGFMAIHTELEYDIHITRWHRDALGFCRKYVLKSQEETVRIHILGGTSTVFEIVNAVVDLPNAQIASYPMGRANTFLHYYGLDNTPLFASVKNQVFSDVIGIDAIRCNHNYGISNVLIGLEAYVDYWGDNLIEKTRLPSDLCYSLVAIPRMWKNDVAQLYKISLDGNVFDGKYLSIMVANQPWYSEGFCPGIDARPDDGLMDIYMTRDVGRLKKYLFMPAYLSGGYKKHPDILLHRVGRRLEISSEELMWLSVDGETFYGSKIDCELLPRAIRFVCPDGVCVGGLG